MAQMPAKLAGSLKGGRIPGGTQTLSKRTAIPRTSSTDSLENHAILLKNSLQARPLQSLKLAAGNGPVAPLSRIELLLAPHRPQEVYHTTGAGRQAHELNARIKQSDSWEQLQQLLCEERLQLTASSLAYMLYRLGCLSAFMTDFRKQECKEAGLAEELQRIICTNVAALRAPDLILVLDGLARLRLKPAPADMDALADRALHLMGDLKPTEVPKLVWAFATLGYSPQEAVWGAVDRHIRQHAPALTPQGVSLALWGYKVCHSVAGHVPGKGVLAALCDNLRHKQALFKPHEVANSLQAFSDLHFQPPAALVKAIAARAGQSIDAPSVRARSLQSLSNNSSKAILAGQMVANHVVSKVGRSMRDFDDAVASVSPLRPSNRLLS